MNFRNCFFLTRVLLSVFLVSSFFCSSCTGGTHCHIVLMEWNAQTFFDAIETGSEFKEYRGSTSAWSKARYAVRLDRLKEALLLAGERAEKGSGCGPDLVVLEEIENERVLRDLCNRLPRRCSFPYAVFSPQEKDSAFGSAVLSRYPIQSVTVHSVAGHTDDGARFGSWDASAIALRPLLEATIDIEGRALVLFAAHWKSKSGSGESLSIRRAQERLLLARIATLSEERPGIPWIACGDFNQRPEEFVALGKFPNCWTGWFTALESASVSGPSGSYWYRGNWDAIDHVFLSPESETAEKFSLVDFRVLADTPLIGTDGTPARYEVFSGNGYSDHLPLLAVFSMSD